MRRILLTLAAVATMALLAVGAASAVPGNLDRTFSGDGKVVTNFPGPNPPIDTPEAMVLQPDRKLVVVGSTESTDPSNFDIALARYNPDGSLDRGFGNGGRVTTDLDGAEQAFAVVLQPDGRLVVAGTDGPDFLLVRYNPDGSVDGSFGVGGVVTTAFDGDDPGDVRDDVIRDLLVRDDGTLVAAGYSDDRGGNSDFALASYNPDGSLDGGFGQGGKVRTSFVNFSYANAIVAQPDGKFVAAGTTSYSFGTYFALARYNADGSPDASFGGDGKVQTDLGGTDIGHDLAIRPDGKLIEVGYSTTRRGHRIALARHNPDGTLDRNFGNGGKVLTSVRESGQGRALALQADGRILVAGGAFGRGVGTDFALLRYRPGGDLDNGFGNGGKVFTDFRGGSSAEALLLQPNGRPVAAGVADEDNFAVARYTAR